MALVVGLAPAAFAQTGMIKGKVVDAEGKPVAGAQISIEFADGVNRKFEVKTDRRGEFIQIGLAARQLQGHRHASTSSARRRSRRACASARPPRSTSTSSQARGGADPAAAAKAAELKKLFEEGVAASKAKQPRPRRSRSSTAAAARAELLRLLLQHRLRLLAEEGREAGRGGVAEGAGAEGGLLRSAQRAGDALQQPEALRRSGGDGRQGGGAGGGAGGSADAVYNQGIILWNQGKIPEAKVKFEEALKANPNHAESNFQLGMALLNEGKMPEAIAAFEKYLSARSRRPVRRPGQGDARAAEEVRCRCLRCLRSAVVPIAERLTDPRAHRPKRPRARAALPPTSA